MDQESLPLWVTSPDCGLGPVEGNSEVVLRWCPRSVLLRNDVTGDEFRAPCRVRTCPWCGPNIYRRSQERKILGVVRELAGRRHAVKEGCLTAPGADVLPGGDPRCLCGGRCMEPVEQWNAREPDCWKAFTRRMRRLYPGLLFAAVVEVQKRGAFHVHFITIGVDGMIDMEFMRSCAVESGYGPRIQLQSADRRRRAGVFGAVKYLTKYITKSLSSNFGGRQPVRFSTGWRRAALRLRAKFRQVHPVVGRWLWIGCHELWERAARLEAAYVFT